MMELNEEWKKCFKIKPAFVRKVRGEKEEVNTREGITWAHAETDFVMCGVDEDGVPNEADIYPIKKETFQNSYRVDEELEEAKSNLLCRHTGKPAELLVDISRKFRTSDVDMLRRIEDYNMNPQRHQTMLTVIGDERDDCGLWAIKEITCTSCEESMSANAAKSHLLTQQEYDEYKTLEIGLRKDFKKQVEGT